MMNPLLKGASYFFDGFKLLKHPRILPFVVFPVLINAALLYFGFQTLTATFDGWLASFGDKIPDWLGFIEPVLVWLFRVLLLLVFAFTFTFFANLIGSPFYGLMAEQVEAIKNPHVDTPPFSWKALITAIPRSLIRETQKLMHYLVRLIPLLLLSLLSLVITPLATITPAIWFLFGASMLTVQYVDYSYDNHRRSFKQLTTDLKKQRRVNWGFGGSCTIAAMIPFFNIVAIPAAVCGGTLIFVERLSE